MGLMLGVELVEDRKTKAPAAKKTNALMEATRRRGLLIGKGGLYGNCLRIAPPLIVSEDEVAEALRVLDESLAEI